MNFKKLLLAKGIRAFRVLFVGTLILSAMVFTSVHAEGGPDLIIEKTQSSSFTQGDTGVAYIITVKNIGDAPTSGEVTAKVFPDLPESLTATGMSGFGWTCSVEILECTRNDVLPGGAFSYPIITLTVNVALNAPPQVVVPFIVEGGGDVEYANNEAAEPTTITQVPDLVISKSHTDIFSQGDQNKTYTIIVTNSGYASTDNSLVTVVDTLPAGLTPLYLEGDNWDCDLETLTCTRIGVLPVGESYDTITLTVNVDYDAPTNLTNTVVVSGGGERDTTNNISEDPTEIGQKSDLIITNVTISPTFIKPEDAFDVNITVKNQGGITTESIVYRDVYIGNDPSEFIDPETGCPFDEGDYFRSDYNDGLPPDAIDTKAVSVADGLTIGIHQIWVYVDATCINQESIETNNVYGPVNVTVGVNTFQDVPTTHSAWQWVERLYSAGITGGCATSPLKYCPNNAVTRAQMAVFLLRGIHGSSHTPPAVGGSTGFSDVPVTHPFAAWIKQLAADGITGGCGAGIYCPNNPVTRAQMAIFLLRAKHGSSYTPPSVNGDTGFNDVPVSHSAAAWIKQLAAEGITGGCGGGNYCPNNPVTRAQMAIFLVRTFNLP
ncbi:MAG: S-layer homology domain-containing protein [Anaerolineales bacterium]|jgi:uncharacterized repeat protein (TIGR01451 family)|nr:S-layer homology domain-containing protein [Anaerolineales bacterium]WKZ41458.1 MAG: S-layer homology domain-containing protein [Anaerolineales bacterium]